MTTKRVNRAEAVRLLKALLERINVLTTEGADTTALRARYKAAGDAIVDGRLDEAKLVLTSTSTPPPPRPAPVGAVMKIDFVRRRAVKTVRG